MVNTAQKPVNVFLIDDSEVDAFLVNQELKKIQRIQDIAHFDRAQTALDFILDDANKENLPDLILLDITMPVVDGFEFLDELEESDKFPNNYPFKIVLLTNSKTLRDREKFERENNVVKFVEKPIDSGIIGRMINELFN